MRYAGVLFDLYGTLIPPFRRREHMETVEVCARCLEIGFDDCHRLVGDTYARRVRGDFASVADNFDWIVRQTGRRATPAALASAEAAYLRFTAESLAPVAGALELLAWLAARGLRIGLVSNCNPDIPRLWSASALAPYIDYCAFSCQVGAVKPEPAIYQAALAALDLRPAETLYVGDGSDEELSGAARCGMQPVLVAADLTNTYDARRVDVDGWSGPTIRSLSELPMLLEASERIAPAP